jgi:hypothetical protein
MHHIDDNPNNHDEANLAVLCLECHHETQITGGFSRKLDAAQVREFRADWVRRVAKRRRMADQLVSERLAGMQQEARPAIVVEEVASAQEPPTKPTSAEDLLEYIRMLPKLRRDVYSQARPLWDSGVTAQMMEGNYKVINALEQILVQLASQYPEGHFGGRSAEDYINAMTASRFQWHRAHLEPDGAGTGGTIVGVSAGGAVIEDLEVMVRDVVRSLHENEIGFFQAWDADWTAE